MDKNRANLLNKISKAGFVLNELSLFLDTHQTDVHALRYYDIYYKKHEEFVKEYERLYGPLTRKMTSPDRWTWCDGPWPWENEFNEGIL